MGIVENNDGDIREIRHGRPVSDEHQYQSLHLQPRARGSDLTGIDAKAFQSTLETADLIQVKHSQQLRRTFMEWVGDVLTGKRYINQEHPLTPSSHEHPFMSGMGNVPDEPKPAEEYLSPNSRVTKRNLLIGGGAVVAAACGIGGICAVVNAINTRTSQLQIPTTPTSQRNPGNRDQKVLFGGISAIALQPEQHLDAQPPHVIFDRILHEGEVLLAAINPGDTQSGALLPVGTVGQFKKNASVPPQPDKTFPKNGEAEVFSVTMKADREAFYVVVGNNGSGMYVLEPNNNNISDIQTAMTAVIQERKYDPSTLVVYEFDSLRIGDTPPDQLDYSPNSEPATPVAYPFTN